MSKFQNIFPVILALCLLVSGCCTKPPSIISFPEPPAILMSDPQPLLDLPDGEGAVPAQEVAGTMVKNYNIYHETAKQLKQLQKWIVDQRSLAGKKHL